MSLYVSAMAGCFLTVSALADTQYWATVGSYESASSAQRASRVASDTLAAEFSVAGAETGKGYFYRVVAGPYVTRQLADDRVNAARLDGYPTAWVWIDSTGAVAESVVEIESLSILTDQSSGDVLDDYERSGEFVLDQSYSESSTYPSGGDAAEIEGVEARQPAPELVDVAPADYNLNKMIRDE